MRTIEMSDYEILCVWKDSGVEWCVYVRTVKEFQYVWMIDELQDCDFPLHLFPSRALLIQLRLAHRLNGHLKLRIRLVHTQAHHTHAAFAQDIVQNEL